MEIIKNKKGFLGIFPKWMDLAVLMLCITGFVYLQWWSLPRQQSFLMFMIILEAVIFILSIFKPSWGLFFTILVIPGITTSSLTVFNQISSGPDIKVFGPASLFPALSFVFGVWLRTILKNEQLADNKLRVILNAFMGLTLLSAVVIILRYANLWPFGGWTFIDRIVNIDKTTTSSAVPKTIWAFVNYVTGPLLFLSICQAGRLKKSQWQKWSFWYILTPLFLGSAAPLTVGMPIRLP